MSFEKGHIPWNKGIKFSSGGGTPFQKGHVPWNKSLSKRQNKRIRQNKLNIKGFKKSLCIVCGKPFCLIIPTKVYCSKYCRDKAYSLRSKEKLLLASKGRTDKVRGLVIDYLGGECVNCGEKDYRVLQVNHINGDGKKDRNNRSFYKQICDGRREGEFDLRCANCNILYEYECGRKKENIYNQ